MILLGIFIFYRNLFDFRVFILTFYIFIGIFTDYTLRYVALGSAILGITSGALGCFTVLRKQSLFGDALSHAALPGIGLAYLFAGESVGWINSPESFYFKVVPTTDPNITLGMAFAVFILTIYYSIS